MMGGTVFALCGVTLALALCELLLPGEAASGTKHALRTLGTLAILLVLLTPSLGFLKDAADSLPELLPDTPDVQAEDFEQIFLGAIEAQSASDLSEGIASLLAKEFGKNQADFAVRVSFFEDGTLQRISVQLQGAALLLDPKEVTGFLGDHFDCLLEVR